MYINFLQKLGDRIKKEKETEASNTALDFLRYPNLRKKFIIVTFCWYVNWSMYIKRFIRKAHSQGHLYCYYEQAFMMRRVNDVRVECA